jgi:hypothetical protein
VGRELAGETELLKNTGRPAACPARVRSGLEGGGNTEAASAHTEMRFRLCHCSLEARRPKVVNVVFMFRICTRAEETTEHGSKRF